MGDLRPTLVTGAGGFIGSHLCRALADRGEPVRAFLHYNSRSSRGWLAEADPAGEIEAVCGDIRDFDAVDRAVAGCRRVFHLAALIGIPYSYESPLAYVQTNVVGAYNVLEAVRRRGLEELVLVSTSETYGTPESVPIPEAAVPSAQSPYAASKVAADQLALSYHRSFGLPLKIARPFNTFGPRQSARAIIPAVMIQLLAGGDRPAVGSLAPTRDLTYVGDTVAGLLAIGDCGALFGEATNIGSGREISIGDLIGRIARVAGRAVTPRTEERRLRPAASEVKRLCCDAGRLRRATGWTPQVDLDEGLRRTWEWLSAHRDLSRPGDYHV